MIDLPLAARTVTNDCWHDDCPLCGSNNIYRLGSISYPSPILFSTTPILASRVPELWGCRQCRSRFTQNSITEQDAVDLYSAGNSSGRWQTTPFIEHHCREVVQTIEEVLYPNCFVVDVGCNTGEFLDFAKNKGCKTGGVEFSQESRAILEHKGHAIYSNLSAVENASVDVITAFDLVEHLYHPAEFMAECRNKLKPGGRLLIVTGNPLCIGARLSGGRWWYVNYPEHIVFPSKMYFARYTPFKLEQIINTYAGNTYKRTTREILDCTIRGFCNGNYNASPSLGPDHMLVVLWKQN